MKRTFKNKRRAFTLIELLIVIAIIGILFIVLVSKVDFATDKAKTTGVQTDFRSFQMAFETVSRENAGFNTLGWDMGDIKRIDFDTELAGYTYTNEANDAGDRVRNSYDVGDLNLNGKLDSDETWTGRKIYTETWTGIYTLDNPGDAADKSAYILLEEAINKNLDPKLHITINPDTKEITMSNGYQDPWTTEYHGFYLSNAAVDGKDRGAILMYADGPNKQFGSAQVIANGVVTIGVPQNNIQGQDDLSILTIYTYFNGYGEVKTTTSGFSQNQNSLTGGNGNDMNVVPEGPVGGSPVVDLENIEGGLYQSGTNYQTRLYTWQELIDLGWITSAGRAVDGMKTNLAGDLKISNTITSISSSAFRGCTGLTQIAIPESVTFIGKFAFLECTRLQTVHMSDAVTSIGPEAFSKCSSLNTITLSENLVEIGEHAFYECTSLTSISIPGDVTSIGGSAFYGCTSLKDVYYLGELTDWLAISFNKDGYSNYNRTSNPCYEGEANLYFNGTLVTEVNIPTGITAIGQAQFAGCTSIISITIPDGVTTIGEDAFSSCKKLASVALGENSQLAYIDTYAFAYCTDLTSITIPDGVTNIYANTFEGCSGLKSVTFGENSQLASINTYAFHACTSLESITIPDSVTRIRNYAFQNCTSLNTITFDGTLAQWNAITFDGSSWNKNVPATTVQCSNGTVRLS